VQPSIVLAGNSRVVKPAKNKPTRERISISNVKDETQISKLRLVNWKEELNDSTNGGGI
jgi:hypothetical protein